eukprot:CAMPEP_0113672526 /NCGR_PEP_ID=MMETSP0038_2-20120614/6321_1 /TAXON_ID=2898 /ORGANISM="Cryptomonas paramecium" /LENGTH=1543 /DNA_ID=CAMNT_0000588823 /DNA_START=420 /DNA_END=5048 /DNA_ORIENTATION=- /assembly_acc=CAM_ASM_000170
MVLVCRYLLSDKYALPGGCVDADSVSILPESKRTKDFLVQLVTSNADKELRKLENKFDKTSPKSGTSNDNALILAKVKLNRARDRMLSVLDKCLTQGTLKYPPRISDDCIGYSDDPRNTDDSWIETRVYHYHIPCAADGAIDFFKINDDNAKIEIKDRAGNSQTLVYFWVKVDSGYSVYRELQASHKYFIDQCLPVCDCGRRRFDRHDGSHSCQRFCQRSAAFTLDLNARDTSDLDQNHELDPDGFFYAYAVSKDGKTISMENVNSPLESPTISVECSSSEREINKDVLRKLVLTRVVTGGTQVLLFRPDSDTTEFDFPEVTSFIQLFQSHGLDCNSFADFERTESVRPRWLPGPGDHASFAVKNGVGERRWMQAVHVCLSQAPSVRSVLASALHSPMAVHIKWFESRRIRSYCEENFAPLVPFFVDICVPECSCGLPEPEHTNVHEKDSSIALFKTDHDPDPSSCFKFRFEGRSSTSTFVRSAVKCKNEAQSVCFALFGGASSPNLLWRHENRFWRPNAIISLTGSAFDLSLSDSMKDAIFSQGIVKAAVTMGALIIDGGMNAGVMREMGKAVARESRAQLLGICSWGAVLQREQLHLSSSSVGTYVMSDKFPNSEWGAQLEPNHKMFVMVDSAFQGKRAFGTEIGGRARIERALRGNNPHVVVVIDGGVNTIKTVYELSGSSSFHERRLQNDDKLKVVSPVPILVVNGTGRAADFISAVYKHLHKGDSRECTKGIRRAKCINHVMPQLHSKSDKSPAFGHAECCAHLQAEFCRCFNKKEMTENDIHSFSMVIHVCSRKDLVTIVDTDQISSLSYHLMKAACDHKSLAGKDQNTISRLKTILKWNDGLTSRLMKEMIHDLITTDPAFTTICESLFYWALMRDNHQAIKAMLDCGVTIQDADVIESDISSFDDEEKSLVQAEQKRKFQVKHFMGCKLSSKCEELTFMGWKRVSKVNLKSTSEIGSNIVYDMNNEELFLWALLNGKTEVAKICWSKAHPRSTFLCVARALFGSAISRKRATLSDISNEQEQELLAQGDYFENVAVEILDLCQWGSDDIVVEMLQTPVMQPWMDSFLGSSWSDTNDRFLTPLQLAYMAGALKALSTSSFQTCLKNIWYGGLSEDIEEELCPETDNLASEYFAALKNSFGENVPDEILVLLLAFTLPLAAFVHVLRKNVGKSSGLGDIAQKWWMTLEGLYSAPMTKFVLAFSSHVAFCGFFTYVSLNMNEKISWSEVFVDVWILALFIAELRQIIPDGLDHFTDERNFFDNLMLTSFCPAFVLRMLELAGTWGGSWTVVAANGTVIGTDGTAPETSIHYAQGQEFGIARSWYGLVAMFFWLRNLDYLRITKSVGPMYLVLINIMWRDVYIFLVFVIICWLAFGTAVLCASSPSYDASVDGSNDATLANLVYYQYMMLFGEHFMNANEEYLSSHPEGNFASDNRLLATILVGIYLFFSTIVLTNLLIAQMNSTYTDVLDKSKELHKLQWCGIVLEFSSHSLFTAPLGVIEDLVMIYNLTFRRKTYCHPTSIRGALKLLVDQPSAGSW